MERLDPERQFREVRKAFGFPGDQDPRNDSGRLENRDAPAVGIIDHGIGRRALKLSGLATLAGNREV